MPERAIVFIDGNNWYHACRAGGLNDLFALDYAAVSRKLLGPREWVETRYYIGALKQSHPGFREQRQFISRIKNQDDRISVHLGRIEERPQENKLATKLLAYAQSAVAVSPEVREELVRMANEHRLFNFFKEKAADVMLAVQMAKLAIQDEFDCAYLLSADGDFTPAVETVRELGKKVYAASVAPSFSSALHKVANTFIPLKKEWFTDCFRFDP